MSEPKKKFVPEGRRFKKGESGNPKGRPPMPEGLKQLKKLTKDEFQVLINKYWSLSVAELEELCKDTTSMTAMDACLAQAVYNMAKNGSLGNLNLLLDRTIGTVTQNMNLSGNLNASITDFIASRKKKTESTGE